MQSHFSHVENLRRRFVAAGFQQVVYGKTFGVQKIEEIKPRKLLRVVVADY